MLLTAPGSTHCPAPGNSSTAPSETSNDAPSMLASVGQANTVLLPFAERVVPAAIVKVPSTSDAPAVTARPPAAIVNALVH